MNKIKPNDGARRLLRSKKNLFPTTKKTIIMPDEHSILQCRLTRSADNQSGEKMFYEVLEKETELTLTSSLKKSGQDNDTLEIAVVNITDHPVTIEGEI